MQYQIIWSAFAEKQIDEIFEYYKDVANRSVASKITTSIITAPEKLVLNPKIGQVEELIQRTIEYRYFVHKNYKLIYSIDEKKQQIRIADVFDTRQNPVKIDRNA